MSRKAFVITKCMEESTWKAGDSSLKKEISCIFCHFHKSPLFLRVLSRKTKSSPMEESPSKIHSFWFSKERFFGFTKDRHFSIKSTLFFQILQIHTHIILPPTTTFSSWSLSFRFPHQNPECTYSCHTCTYVPPIWSSFTRSPTQYSVRNKTNKGPYHACCPVLLNPKYITRDHILGNTQFVFDY